MANASASRPEFRPLEEYRIAGMPEAAYYIPDFLTPAESTALLAAIAKQPWTTLTHRRLQPHPAPLTPAGHLLTAKALPPFLAPVINGLLELSFADAAAEVSVDAICGTDTQPHENDTPDGPTGSSGRTSATRGIFTSSPHGAPNHVLINEYPPGTGISPHEDGAAYFPVVCTVSLGSHIVLEVSPKHESNGVSNSTTPGTVTGTHTDNVNINDTNGGKGYRILQEPLSLLITTSDLYTSHLHGIAPITVDENLTAGTIANWGLLGPGTREKVEAAGGVLPRTEVRVSLTCRDVIKVRDAGWVFGAKRR